MDRSRVYIAKRQRGTGKPAFHLRWMDPATGRKKSRKVGTDRRRANHEAALLEQELGRGTHRDLQRITWEDFSAEHVASLPGKANAAEARIALREFGEQFGCGPRDVSFAMIEKFSRSMEDRGNKTATRNKKMRYLRAAFNLGIRRGYIAKSPMAGWRFTREDRKPPRIITPEEEVRLLNAAQELYGSRLRAFVVTCLGTGGRRSEVCNLTWDRIDLDAGRVHFTRTKAKTDRIIPVDDNPTLLDELRRLQVQTQQAGGPFIGLGDNLWKKWVAIRTLADLPGVTVHDCRRTFCCRLIRAGCPLPTVQRLAGHSKIETTLRFYHWVSDEDMSDGMKRMHAAQSAG